MRVSEIGQEVPFFPGQTQLVKFWSDQEMASMDAQRLG